MRKLYPALLFLSGATLLSAQESNTLWQRDLPSPTQDFLAAMSATIDGQILISGSTINTNNAQQISTGGSRQNNGYDYRAVKLDQRGNPVWEKRFGGSRHDYLAATATTLDGGFLLAGTSYSNRSGDKSEDNVGGSDVWLLRLDGEGNELWQKTFGTRGNDEASAAVQTADGGFLVAGNISSGGFGSKDVFATKIDSGGNVLKTVVLGGSNTEEVQEMAATEDGGAILIAYSRSGKAGMPEGVKSGDNAKKVERYPNRGTDLLQPANPDNQNSQPTTQSAAGQTGWNTKVEHHPKSEDGFGEGDYWIVKLDRDGKVEWQRTYGGSGDDHPKTIVSTKAGYLVGGESRSKSSGNKREDAKEGTDLWLLSLDKDGGELWQRSYSFGNRDVLMSANVIRRTNRDYFSEDAGFLLGGYTQAEERIQTDDEKFWLLYIGVDGREEWRKHVEGKSRKKEERLVSAQMQHDGTFLLAGTSAQELGGENWKVVKLGDKDLEGLVEKRDIRIYPNPVDDFCYVEVGFDFDEAEIALYDMTGKAIQTLKTRNRVTKLNTANLPQGVYVVAATTENEIVNAKIVKK